MTFDYLLPDVARHVEGLIEQDSAEQMVNRIENGLVSAITALPPSDDNLPTYTLLVSVGVIVGRLRDRL